MIHEVREQLRGDEEVPRTVGFAGDLDHGVVDSAFGP